VEWKYQVEEFKYRARDAFERARDALKEKPAIGYGIAGAVLLVAVVIAVVRLDLGGSGPRIATNRITVRFEDTGEEMEFDKVLIERGLRDRTPPLDASVGIVNPKTDKPTGFPKDRDWWKQAIDRASSEAIAAKKAPGRTN
jgi:hypothetical protein